MYVKGSAQLHTLQDVSFRRHYRAERGTHGKGSNWTGRQGSDVTIELPLGTIVTDAESGRILCDCVESDNRHIVARGGRGGKGTAELTTRANPSPQYAMPGEPGEERNLRLTLKVLADVGLVGRPNAGKSTFLSRISRAHPEIADYPFTTLTPHLGIVRVPDRYETMVVADIPGIIEDSHTGKGLGIRFLRHIERTSILAIMVESTSPDPRRDADVLLRELRAYSEILAEKPRCCILTKTDLLDERDRVPRGWLSMSAVTGDGVDRVLRHLFGMLDELRADEKQDGSVSEPPPS